ncbi:uncharacterized protein JCM6883_006303 [Sporobolomyces salmoneus]|uniref:uncharacterized protein n=1 Tax=Sporobolomyces salmoneus TaxID=183962 RepID=UPI00317812DA
MLSRLKRRTASTSLPPDQEPPLVTHEDDPPSSPTASRRTSQSPSSANNTPSKQSVHSNRTLSPTRAVNHHYAPSMSRSSSYGSVVGMDSTTPSEYSMAGGGGGGGARVGEGSLSLDHLTPQDGSAPLTLVVQAPELINNDNNATTNVMSEEDPLATPMPGRPVELRTQSGTIIATSASLASGTSIVGGTGSDPTTPLANPSQMSALHASHAMSRPRAFTTSEAAIRSSNSRSRSPAPRSQVSSVSTILPSAAQQREQQQQQSGLDALAKINSPNDISSNSANDYLQTQTRPHSNSVPTSPPSHSRPHSRSVSRPNSRAPSFNSQSQARPDFSSGSGSLHPPSSTSAGSPTRSRSRRGTKSNGSSNGIAGAIALSGVALASPSSQLRHPLGLARVGSHAPPTQKDSSPAPATPTSNNVNDLVGGGGGGGGPGSPALSTTGGAGGGDSHSYITGGGRRSAASSMHNGVTPIRSRESIDSQVPLHSPSDSRRESEIYSSPFLGGVVGAGGGHQGNESLMSFDNEHGFLSMDQLGDFDNVVSQLGTGYAVASSKRNSDFHALFKNIEDDDYLIEDYGCALQREILIQGRLYISEHHLSFYANIFGWVTSLTIPFAEVCSIEKRMTAYVIPNAIQIATMHARHTFASFLSRDTTYDLIGNIWKMVHPVIPTSAGLPDHSPHGSDDEGGVAASTNGDDAGMTSGVEKETGTGGREGRGMRKRLKGFRRPRGGTGESSNAGGSKIVTESNEPSGGGGGSGNNSARPGSPNGGGGGKDTKKRQVHSVTKDTCPTLKNLKEVCMDTVFPSAPEKIYNLMFTSGFMKDFWTENQKLLDLQIGDWAPQATGSNLLARSFSYIKPLNGSIGPKQTKCLITDESAHVDFDDFVCVVTTTKTPDVPSGSAFAVKTRTSMTWAKGNSCRVVVTTGVEWSKSSFIKGIIEKSCIDGQKTYHTDLEKAMRSYITTHRNEFIEEGQSDESDDDDEGDDEGSGSGSTAHGGGSTNHRDGEDSSSSLAGSTSKDSISRSWMTSILECFEPILDLVSEQSPKTLIVGIVLFVLVVSNLWTLSSGRGKEISLHPSERRKSRTPSTNPGTGSGTTISKKRRSAAAEVDTRTPDEVASAVRDVLQDYFKQQQIGGKPEPSTLPISTSTNSSSRSQGGGDGSESWLRDEAGEIGKVLDQLEERIRILRTRLLLPSSEEEEEEEETD